MKFNTLSLAITAGIFWAVSVLFIHLYPSITGALFSENMYGNSMKFIVQDMYPFYKNASGWYAPLIGMIFGFIDGFICGGIFAWLYNLISGKLKK